MARATVKLKWFGDKVLRDIRRKRIVPLLNAIGELIASDVRRDISTSTRAHGPSLPGESPHADEGTLRKSIDFEVDERKLVVRIGTNEKHGLFLEAGTKHMDARPYLRPAIPRNRKRIITLLKKKRP